MEMSSVIFGSVEEGFGDVDSPEVEFVYCSEDGHSRLGRAVIDGKVVCVKALKEEYIGNPVYEGLLEKEYEIGSALVHPNICATLDFRPMGALGNCIVMEWIEGETLERLLKDGEMTPALARKVILELCDALDALHHRQIVHRDIKPGNIMLTRNGRNVKLIDFGLADTDTHAGLKMAAGTESYAAPEQVRGAVLDERSDIYALGKVIEDMAETLHGSLAARRSSRFWKGVAAKCSVPEIGSRVSDASALKQLILKKERFRRQLPIVLSAAALAIVIILWLCAPHISRLHERHKIDVLVRGLTKELLSSPTEYMSSIPFEVKSGKDYMIHSALDKFIANKDYATSQAYVLSNEAKVFEKNGVTYVPIYFVMFFEHDVRLAPEEYIF